MFDAPARQHSRRLLFAIWAPAHITVAMLPVAPRGCSNFHIFHHRSRLEYPWRRKHQWLPRCQSRGCLATVAPNVGNPHMICLDKKHFEPNPRGLTLTNFHSVIQKDNNTFEVRCFERGVGETQACGSGAYAVGSAMMQHFNLEEVNIEMKGGKYTVKPQTLIVKI